MRTLYHADDHFRRITLHFLLFQLRENKAIDLILRPFPVFDGGRGWAFRKMKRDITNFNFNPAKQL